LGRLWLPPQLLACEEGAVMALKITHRDENGADVLELDGRLVGGEETTALREKVKSLLAEGKKNMVLDLSGVTMIDSTGLGALVTAHSSAKSGGASLRLCNLGSRSKHLLQITKLYTIFEVSDTDNNSL
jgi:anti-sigma B factor antagonist